ncbi:arsenate reductase [Chromobacterium amazonense]|uniref:Arsenate reductase n=1 Tax=Chromobacterium amazonense TaxID=1382803 RepID=A0ABU8V1U7_9NEIS|nr:arsenate reductase [Chromobacterium amazonense]KIA80526.1 arsenate reductase [Chromobacterium piscinae]MBM2886562.1 arsenate reductase [Chromobacterium amazonense]MDE1712660.1 arsenate reductase [Chromobacterium amazonense]MDQ4541579.1 arsenate reductase [Chromobacterium amazonense]
MITLYGIPNCNTVKKARQWLADNGIDYVFHDFKKQGIDAARLQAWTAQVPLAKLVNRQGTTWRALPDDSKAAADETAGAIALMLDKPSVIKRPVLEWDGKVGVGFSEADWAERFGK